MTHLKVYKIRNFSNFILIILNQCKIQIIQSKYSINAISEYLNTAVFMCYFFFIEILTMKKSTMKKDTMKQGTMK